MSWNYDRTPGNWQGNWNPNNPGTNQGNWGWGNYPHHPTGEWGQGFNQGNWGGTWTSNQPWSGQRGWYGQQGWMGNQPWGPWNAPGITGYWAPWSNNPNQGNYGQGNYGPWNYGYGTAYGHGPQTGYGQGFGNYPFEENQGRFAGVGPQGYRRSDQRVGEDVCDELSADSYLDAHDVNVQVNNGLVTLTGTVPTRDMRRRAEEDADSVMGVNDVRNDLRVAQPMGGETGMMATEPTTTMRTRGTTR